MSRTIRVDYLARVEGEGALTIHFDGEKATEVLLRIFEPPRFFEAFLRGRDQGEAPDITSRICGICPVAYMMSACHAIEDALGIRVDEPVAQLRRLLYCGEWIESHALHMFMLHAPDFLGFEDGVQMAKKHPDIVKSGLSIKKAGNAIVRCVGGREIHPINVRVGGFYRAPTRADLDALVPELESAKDAMVAALPWMASFSYPDFERDYELVAMQHERDYPFCEGRIVSSRGLDIDVREYDDHFTETHVPHSTALHSHRVGGGAYFCGPLARVNLNFDRLPETVRKVASEIGFSVPCKNPFKSILARGIETLFALEESLRIIGSYRRPERPAELPRRAAVGYGCTEAPRGLLYHRYRVDEGGAIVDAKIVPPTSQNQKTIEEDLFGMAPRLAAMPHEEATWLAEQAIRNYDPCISCSTHFLTLKIERGRP